MTSADPVQASQTTIQRESYAAVAAELPPLMAELSATICEPQGLSPAHLDDRLYRLAESVDRLRVYTARDAGRLIGFAFFLVRENPHHLALWAYSDMIWMTPAARRPTVGLRLLRHAEEDLIAAGVEVIQAASKIAHVALGRLLEHMGYQPVEIVHQKVPRNG